MHSLVGKKMRKVKKFRSRSSHGEDTLIDLDGNPKNYQDTVGLANDRKKEVTLKDQQYTHNAEDAEFDVRKKIENVKGNRHRTPDEEDMSKVWERRSQNDIGVVASLIASLKACAVQKDLRRASILHNNVVKRGLLIENVYVGSALISMYAKCGALEKAQEVFDELRVHNTVSWTALIAGYAQHGHAEEALICFEQMQIAGFSPDAVTFVCILKACGSIGASNKGEEIHAHILRERLLGNHIVVGNALIDMYAKCGALEKAQEVFDELPSRNVVSWNALIAGYSQRGHGKQALNCFEQMQLRGFSPNAATFTCIFKACGSLGALDKGQEVHTQIVKECLLGSDLVLASALVDMYAKCGALEKAQKVFDEISIRDVVLWNALIGGYAQHGHGEKALSCFQEMQFAGFSPNAVTLACILKACGSIGALVKGEEIRAQIVRDRMLGKDVMVSSALIDMFAKCGALEKAQEVFDELPVRDVVVWNALIAGYAQWGHSEDALRCFEQMQVGGFSPDAVTFACILKSCGSIGALSKGEEIHAQIVKEQFLDKNVVVANALIYMYAKCGALEKAQEVLDDQPIRDIVSWTAVITGYVQHERGEDALNCFTWMQLDGFSPDAFTFACTLKACGSIGAAYRGQKLHSEIVKLGLLESDHIVGIALVVMYANCGMLGEAQQQYNQLLVWDVTLWSVLMVGYAQLGLHTIVFYLFDKMIGEGIEPDPATFTIVFNTCSHCGLVDEGQMIFESISKGYGIIPTLEHYTCMVDLFGRVERLDKAVILIEEMPLFANLTMWLTLLGACQKLGNVKLGTWAFEHALRLDEKGPAAYVCMSNIYAAGGRQGDAGKLKL